MYKYLIYTFFTHNHNSTAAGRELDSTGYLCFGNMNKHLEYFLYVYWTFGFLPSISKTSVAP